MIHYWTTPLEDYIEKLYRSINITEPYQLDMTVIAERLNFWIYFLDCKSMVRQNRKGFYSMIIDRRLSPQEQWEDFGHEMSHILRDAGNQLYLPESFIEYQEVKAKNFAYHFCVPTFMLIKEPLPNTEREATLYIAETFNVTLSFARERLKKFTQQKLESEISIQMTAAVSAQERFFRERGCDFTVRTSSGTLLYNRHKGLIGLVKRGDGFAE